MTTDIESNRIATAKASIETLEITNQMERTFPLPGINDI